MRRVRAQGAMMIPPASLKSDRVQSRLNFSGIKVMIAVQHQRMRVETIEFCRICAKLVVQTRDIMQLSDLQLNPDQK